MKINGENLFLALIEADEADEDYRKSSVRYYRAHGHGVHLDREPKNADEKHIVYAYHAADRAESVVWSIFDVIELSTEERINARKAARAYKRLCVRLDWQRYPKPETVEALLRFIES